MTELAYRPATELLAAYRDRSLSPVDVLEALIVRVEETEPAINAVAERLFDEARQQARAAEAVYRERPEDARPLEGLPVAAKAEHAMAGRPLTEGSLVLVDEVATANHPVIERVQAAGGIIHIRTTTPEFSCAPFTHSRLWGITRNPWHLDYSPGGSSGGSAASLAAGTTPLATGSDIGGSIRIPASFAGVVGFKPSYGRVPGLPPFNLDGYCHDGPLARNVADCALLFNVLVGPHRRDVVSIRPAVKVDAGTGSAEGLRVAYAVNPGDWVVDQDVAANTEAVAVALRRAGAQVDAVEIGWKRDEIALALSIHFAAIFGPVVGDVAAKHADLLTPYALAFAESAKEVAATTRFVDGLAIEGRVYDAVAGILDDYDALICPTSGTPALRAGANYVRGQAEADGEVYPHFDESIMTAPFNILSRCPVLAVPSGWSAEGVPTGIQVVGKTYDDATVFRVASAVEAARPWGYTDGRVPSLSRAGVG